MSGNIETCAVLDVIAINRMTIYRIATKLLRLERGKIGQKEHSGDELDVSNLEARTTICALSHANLPPVGIDNLFDDVQSNSRAIWCGQIAAIKYSSSLRVWDTGASSDR